ncbi:MAG: glycine cleavage system protein GcvH [Candidatus Marinimicrobia bacterium]|jgi:glycine cleavage system H protein|nr:glycine cleavage system protein GcvH [Candidatus Neomarinimicrobiota bacterium]MBT4359885.1 glycine cleavage system protein GcvH [Candidatus Neomarinimicrobiota bacterium]MBT4716145.1 glycine cleavage system protein GcvH [Candidatus Neomarinimicrobiota bacterium]MBT4947209.1 glycine cleavage system protein GcvH [Candidatus Neomarinimicrobiota bacterium]MBT5271218.1 glycine cleavage system protein GcvH [Candidatus Neomarinimicrobiota bacterium]
MNVPAELQYTSDHEWIRVEGDSAIIGITDYAQGELGDVVFVELPGVDEEFEKGDVAATIEAVKTVADLFLPLGGSIEAVNEQLDDTSELINQDAYGEGWILKVKMSNASELDSCLSAEEYIASIS